MLIVVRARVKAMDIFRVSLFGHKEIDNLKRLEDQLVPIIKELLQTKPYVSFLIVRNGEFDEYAASFIKIARREVGGENSDITLVLPYTVKDMEYYKAYYDSIIIPDILYRAHVKKAITLRNRFMIDCSDLVIVYVEKDFGGAYNAMKYAIKANKRLINLFTGQQSEALYN